MIHTPVLLEEILKYLDPRPGGKFIDATINGGGHALAILKLIKPGGKLLGIEWDSELFARLNSKIQILNSNHKPIIVNDSYVNLKKIAEKNNFTNVDGIIFDFGMSSWHLEESGRGFTFQKNEPLDMRFDPGQLSGLTAKEIINKWPKERIARILREYGGERFARNIARAIEKERKEMPINTTFQLLEIIKRAIPFRYRHGRRIHYATRTFQSLRIAVNDELGNIQKGLAGALSVLKSGGRLAVVSFHSLEDRIVKVFFKENEKTGLMKILTKKPVAPTLREIEENPRARSAKLRIAEKI